MLNYMKSWKKKVAIRTKELNDNNLHLEKTLQELKSTQMQLIHTEKNVQFRGNGS